MAAAVGPLTALMVYLDNHPQINAGWFYLVGLCILLFSFLTVRAFPFNHMRPQRVLLRFYLTMCLIFELIAFNFYEPGIPVVREIILLGSLAMVLYTGYRPTLDVFLPSRADKGATDKNKRA